MKLKKPCKSDVFFVPLQCKTKEKKLQSLRKKIATLKGNNCKH